MVILAPVDGEAVPDSVVSVGYDLANAYDDDLVVMHVMPQKYFDEKQEETALGTKGTVLAPEVDYGFESEPVGDRDAVTIDEHGEPNAESVAHEVAKGTLDDLAGVSFQGRVGDPTKEILAEAERRDARHIVVGGRDRTPVGKAVLGSTTQSVLLSSDRPVTRVSK